MNIIGRIKGWWQSLFSKKDIEEALQIEVAITDEMRQKQELWRKVFIGKAPWNDEKIKSRRLAKGICNKVATKVTVKFESEVSGDNPRAEYLDRQYQRVVAINGKDGFRSTVEKALAGGTIVFRPFVKNGDIYVRVVENNCYYPIRYNELGKLIEVVFPERIYRNKQYYTLLEKQIYNEKEKSLTIEYTVWISDKKNSLGKKVNLTDVEEWANLQPYVKWSGIEHPWFIEFVTPALGTEEEQIPQGHSLFANALDDLQKADEHEELIDHEYKKGRLKQQAPIDLFKKDEQGNPVVDADMFQVFEGAVDDSKEFIRTYNPAFRFEALKARDNEILRHIEFNCELSYGTISDVQISDKTATEVRHSDKETSTTVDSIKGAFEPVLMELVDIMDDMTTRYGLAPQGDYETPFYWDDSTVISQEEKQAAFEGEYKRMLILYQNEMISKARFLAFYNENSDYFSKTSLDMIEAIMKQMDEERALEEKYGMGEASSFEEEET